MTRPHPLPPKSRGAGGLLGGPPPSTGTEALARKLSFSPAPLGFGPCAGREGLEVQSCHRFHVLGPVSKKRNGHVWCV